MAIASRPPHPRFNWHWSRPAVFHRPKLWGLAAVIGVLAVLWSVNWGPVIHTDNAPVTNVLPIATGNVFVPLLDAMDVADAFYEEKRRATSEEFPPQF
jgi:hypothetical protein